MNSGATIQKLVKDDVFVDTLGYEYFYLPPVLSFCNRFNFMAQCDELF